MATVRISRDLINDIERNIKTLADKVYAQTIKPVLPPTKPEQFNREIWYELIGTAIWGEYLHLRDQMPASWMTTPDYFSVTLREVTEYENNIIYSFTHQNSGKIKCPPKTGVYGASVYINLSDCPAPVQDYIVKLKEHDALHKVHIDKFNALTNQVCTFVRASKSLNDAVKRYPDIRLYLSDYYVTELERVEEKRTRKTAEKPELPTDIDTNLISSMGVMRSILQST